MDIEVELHDGDHITVPPEGLDRLLQHHLAKGFRRRSGWVMVGIHPIRTASRSRNGFYGRERRHPDRRVIN